MKELSNSPFGGTLLMTIGKSYHEHARFELGSFDGVAARRYKYPDGSRSLTYN